MVLRDESSRSSQQLERLDALFGAHYERVARVIGRVIHHQARAEELAVEVFLKWWRNPSAHGDSAEGWLYRTAVREALDELRRQTRRARLEPFLAFLPVAPPTPEHQYAATVDQQRVRAVLGRLKRLPAAALILRTEDLSYREIATALQVHPNSVGSLLSRAQDAFRKEYQSRYGTPA